MGAGSLSVTDSCIQRPAIVSVLRTDLIVYCYGNSYHLLSVSGSTFEQAAKYSTFCSMSTHMVDFCTPGTLDIGKGMREVTCFTSQQSIIHLYKTTQSLSSFTVAGSVPQSDCSVGLIPTL